jgi:arsenite methyltransferase
MSIGSYLMSQFARPHGPLGGVFGSLLNRGNRLINQCSLEALEVGSGLRVLDVGFGGGGALEALIAEKNCAYVAGLDPSEKMVRAAGRKLAPWIEEGRLAVRQGTAEDIPWPDSEFDRILSVNSLPYWPDPPRGMREIGRVLRPGGALVLGLRNKASMDKLGIERLGYWSPSESEIETLLTNAGFVALSSQSHREKARGDFVIFRAHRAAG